MSADLFHSWSAVARGAAAKGLEHLSANPGAHVVMNRKSRRNYGTPCADVFIKGKHPESDSYICPYTGQKNANGLAHWLVNKRQDLLVNTLVPHATLLMRQRFWSSESRTQKCELIASNSDVAPQHIYNVVSTNSL